jgi:hypothetical protein
VSVFFGRPWLAGQPDYQQQPTPVGDLCVECGEPIGDSDSGTWCVVTDHGDNPQAVPVHAECQPLSIIGHAFGICVCTDYAGLPTRRAAALELRRRMAEKPCA